MNANITQRLCKDCKHVIPKDQVYDYRCGHPKMERVNLVDGESDPWLCSILRNNVTVTSVIKCTKNGELWERKPVEQEMEDYNNDGVDRR